MNEFDKIIGYTAVKQDLIQIADTLKNPEVYRALGASSPRGLLLYGVPGVGKSLMVRCLIKASGRTAFTCRKTEPDGDFVKTIRETFERAAENAPAIVFLDDMDKFANSDRGHRDSDEYVTIQSCIDEAGGKEVFVLATVNDMDKLPRSLVRAGRFDRVIKVDAPRGGDAAEIIRHYLSRKKLAENINPEPIADILSGRSCATLETIINEAGLLAGYQRAERVTMEHIMEASLQLVFNLKPDGHTSIDLDADSLGARMVYHEAGHAVISELLFPGSVTLVVVHPGGRRESGFTNIRNNGGNWNLRCAEREILVALAGRAAVELRFGVIDTGTSHDLATAFEEARHLVQDLCCNGFGLYGDGPRDDSPELTARQEAVAAAEVERYYRKVREMLFNNRAFFEALAHALAEKGVLTAADIRGIRENCFITEAAV